MCALVVLFIGLPAVVAGQEPPATTDTLPIGDSSVVADTVIPAGPDSAFTARSILVELDSIYSQMIEIQDSLRFVEGEEEALLRVQTLGWVDSLEVLKRSMIAELGVVRSDFPSVDSIRSVFQGFLQQEFTLVEEAIERRVADLDSLRSLRTETPLNGLADLEDDIGLANAQLDTTLAFVIESLTEAEEVGVNTSEQWANVDRFLLSRAAELTGRLQLAIAERSTVRGRIQDARTANADESERAALDLRFRVAELRIDRLSRGLDATADLLDTRRLPTAPYRQLLIQATGEVTSDVLDPTVAVGLVRDWMERIWIWFADAGPNVLVRLALLAGSILLSRAGFRVVWRIFRRSTGSKVSRLLTDLLERMLIPVATLVGFIAGLIAIGIDPTAFLAGLGVLGVIVGLALQDSLANFAAGVFILLYRPFDVDEIVTAGGVTGTVRAMGLATTTIVTFDNRRLFVHNNKVWGEVIENKSAERTRRVDVGFRISHHEDADRIIGLVRDVCTQYDLILDTPEPLIYVTSIDDSLVSLEVRAWAATTDWWSATTQLPRLISKRFTAEGIEPPYPRQIEFEVTQEGGVPFSD
jgi:small conductance mechanosensitive channel